MCAIASHHICLILSFVVRRLTRIVELHPLYNNILFLILRSTPTCIHTSMQNRVIMAIYILVSSEGFCISCSKLNSAKWFNLSSCILFYHCLLFYYFIILLFYYLTILISYYFYYFNILLFYFFIINDLYNLIYSYQKYFRGFFQTYAYITLYNCHKE